MDVENSLALFEKFKIRRVYNTSEDKWYFSVVDIINALEVSLDARNYWKALKSNLKKEGSEVVTKINQLKMIASDGKKYKTDSANVETIQDSITFGNWSLKIWSLVL